MTLIVQIARELGVHRSTISRDVMRALGPDGQPCRTCERPMSYQQWERLNKKRATQQRGRNETGGFLQEEDELPVEDDLGLDQ